MNKTIAGVLSAGLLTVSLGFGAMPASATSNHGKVEICHATGSVKNPFVRLSIDESALEAHKMHQEGQDIYPAPKGGCPTNIPTPGPTGTPTTPPVEPTHPATEEPEVPVDEPTTPAPEPTDPTVEPTTEPTDPALPCPPPNGCANPGPDFPYTPVPEQPAVPETPEQPAPAAPAAPVTPPTSQAPTYVAPVVPPAAPESPVEASAAPTTASDSPTANEGLNVQTAADTGVNSGLIAAGGVVLLAIGAGFTLFGRRAQGTHQ